MAQRREDQIPPAAEEQQGARPGPEGDSNEDKERKERDLSQDVSQGEEAAPLASGEIGIIESIQLENFMCHAMLGPVKLGPNVNFIVGYRGKSALLMALYLGLGGKYLGPSLRQFVKDGEVSATISIILRNRGDDAFKSEVYGASIIIQQSISISGFASYKLKDQAGNLISSKKAELMAIVDHFNIRVDNPACILPQEMGRQLLETRSDAERYKFFLKVTQLEQMSEDYLCIMERKALTQSQIRQGEEQLQELKRQGIQIEECFQSMVASRKRLEDLKHEMAWALVNESEKQIEEMLSNISLGDQQTVSLNEKLEACRVKFNEAAKKFKDIEEHLEQLNKEAAALETECIQAKEDVNRKEEACKNAEVLYNSSQDEFKKLDQAKQHHNQKEDMKKSAEQEKSGKEEKIFMLTEKQKNLKDQEDSLVQEMEHLQQAIEKNKEELSQLRAEVLDIQQILNDEQQQLNRLKDCKTDPLKRFEPQITALLEEVDEAHRQGHFTSKPIGPLGAYIRPRDSEFALAIESCLKDLLLAFCCDNHKDEQVLKELMKKSYPPGSSRPPIIVSAFKSEVYDVTDRAASHPEFPTVLSALEIDDAVVANALIDMRGIESVLLIKSNSLARAVMQAQSPPKNCKEVFTADGDQVFERRYYSSEKFRPTYLIDVEIEIRNLEKEIENTMAQLSVYQQHACVLEDDIRKNQETINAHHLHLKEMKIRVTKINMQIRDLENEENQPEARESKTQIKQVEEKMTIQKEEMKNLRKQKIDAEQGHENIKLKMCQVSELTESVKQELNQANLEMDAEKQYMLQYEERLKQHLDSLQAKKEELTMKEKDLQKELTQAKYICPERKEVSKSASDLDKEIITLKQKIKAEISTHRSRDEIIRQYQEIKERYQGIDVKVKNLKKCINSLDQTSAQRYEIYQQFRRSLALRCKLYFDSLLSEWSYSGEMSFDHKNETLSIRVLPKERSKAALDNLHFLSESETAFSNFFFIITLWSITEFPFRCLDAFDVCMDSVDSRIAMDVILKIARSQQYRQFIGLTPQNLSFLPSSPLTRILQLPDAENVQQTLTNQPDSQEEDD
ncbi:structural maintenance of chromosomes protein 6-like [Dromiciops gliroides]|uniref:structural maintenance of chromosomes protein 6-like n=1 Tax=Dromiciops gliroides TaxID=33562 RepID=UPI001CC51541|nr:structural maintenance of chromosomes protein 6-like [Dromiciops gliroides]